MRALAASICLLFASPVFSEDSDKSLAQARGLQLCFQLQDFTASAVMDWHTGESREFAKRAGIKASGIQIPAGGTFDTLLDTILQSLYRAPPPNRTFLEAAVFAKHMGTEVSTQCARAILSNPNLR